MVVARRTQKYKTKLTFPCKFPGSPGYTTLKSIYRKYNINPATICGPPPLKLIQFWKIRGENGKYKFTPWNLSPQQKVKDLNNLNSLNNKEIVHNI